MTRTVTLASAAIALGAASAPAPIDLPGDKLHPESVSTTPDGRTAYVSSMQGGVLRVTLANGKAEQWIKPGGFGSGSLFGVMADPRNQMLWTCTVDFSAAGIKVAGADAGSWLKGFDLATGEGKVSLALPGPGAVCNDAAVGPDGAVYVADTGPARILRWMPGASALEVWLADATLGSGLDGIAFGGDGNLYVNNVRSGALFRIALAKDGTPGKVTKLATSRPLAGPDGMRLLGGTEFALAENGGRIDRVAINGDTAEVTTLAEGVASPTGVAVAGGTVWYVQGQLGGLFNPNGPRPALPFKLTPIASH